MPKFVAIILGLILLISSFFLWVFFRNNPTFQLRDLIPDRIVSILKLYPLNSSSNINGYNLIINNKEYLIDYAIKTDIYSPEGISLPSSKQISPSIPRDFYHSVISDTEFNLSTNVLDSPQDETYMDMHIFPPRVSLSFPEMRTMSIVISLFPKTIMELDQEEGLRSANIAVNAAILDTLDSFGGTEKDLERYRKHYLEIEKLSKDKLPVLIIRQ